MEIEKSEIVKILTDMFGDFIKINNATQYIKLKSDYADKIIAILSEPNAGFSWIEKDDLAGKRLVQLYDEEPDNKILFETSSNVLRQLIIEGIDIGLNLNKKLIDR